MTECLTNPSYLPDYVLDDDHQMSHLVRLQQLSQQNVSRQDFTNWDGRVVKNNVLVMKPKTLNEIVEIVKAAKQLGEQHRVNFFFGYEGP